ncbi:MAG: hypothetical protein MJY87_07740 [Fibrobacter sp.]|nr:hypothetical protein [Fibrobacter sp.]
MKKINTKQGLYSAIESRFTYKSRLLTEIIGKKLLCLYCDGAIVLDSDGIALEMRAKFAIKTL